MAAVISLPAVSSTITGGFNVAPLRALAPALAFLALLLLWEGLARAFSIPVWLLPKPLDIMSAAWRIRGQLPADIAATIGSTLVGFVCAVGLGIVLAITLAWSDITRAVMSPLLAALQAIPKNALAPIFILWFGTGGLSKVAITFLIAFFPIVVNTLDGMMRVDRDQAALARTLGASSWQTFIHIRLPNAVPYLLAGCKIAITLAIIGAVIAEFVGSDVGLGYLILISSSQLQTDVAFVSIVLLGFLGSALYSLIVLIERLVLPRLGMPSRQDDDNA